MAKFLLAKVKVKLRFSVPRAGVARNRAYLIESETPCRDAQVVGPYRDSNALRLAVLAAMSEDYTTAPQHLQMMVNQIVKCETENCLV